MELIQRLLAFFQSTDSMSKAILIWGAAVGIVGSIRTILAIIAPMTQTKMDDQCLGFMTKLYNWCAKVTDHTDEPLKVKEKKA